MALTGIAGYRIAGHQFADEDFDINANIETSKLGTRTLRYVIPATACYQYNGSRNTSSSFGVIAMPDNQASLISFAIPIPAEYDSGDVVFKVLWNSAATSGDLKLTVSTRPVTTGSAATVAATDTGTATAQGTTTYLNELSVTVAEADFQTDVEEEVLLVKISRDPSDGADTLGAVANIMAISIEFTGRG